MSERIVMLGPFADPKEKTIHAAEVMPLDASASLNGNGWRVYVSRLDGPLANATVLVRDDYPNLCPKGLWEDLMRICHGNKALVLELPLSCV